MALVRGYPGAKSGAGVWQRIVSAMPAHDLYVEAFAGSGAIARLKRPARWTLLVDRDRQACARLAQPGGLVVCGDAVPLLAGAAAALAGYGERALVYVDAPYLRSTRTKRYYRHELETEAEHRELLDVIGRLKCHVMVSHYPHPLYAAMLPGPRWRRVEYMAPTRGGPRPEWLLMNFGPEVPRHDSRFAGDGFRERERIKRKARRWVRMLELLPTAERAALLAAIDEAGLRACLGSGR
jgi:hypothetical protein